MTFTSITAIILSIFLIFNMGLAGFVIFLERRDAGATWAWFLVLFFHPCCWICSLFDFRAKFKPKENF